MIIAKEFRMMTTQGKQLFSPSDTTVHAPVYEAVNLYAPEIGCGSVSILVAHNYRKVPTFFDARKLYCNQLKILTKRPNLSVFCQKDPNGIANSEDPDQTAPLGAV